MAESEREQVISMLRACLLSTKGGIPTTNLERDYKMIVGSRIPYQKLGYQTLDQFLKSIPNVSMSRGRNGEMILDAIPTKNSEHLAALVSKQKSVPKRSVRSLPPRRTAASSWRPPPSAISMKTSRRPVSPRLPLSVTVTNRLDRSRGASFEKPSRLVSISTSMTSSTQNNSVASAGRTPYHSTYEKPPRFLRMEQQQENSAPTPLPATSPTPKPVSAPSTPAPAPAPARRTSPDPFPAEPKPVSRAQDRLQHAVTASVKNLNLMPNSNENAANVGGRTITSPLTPLHARLNAANRKPRLTVNVTCPLEERFNSVSIGGEDYAKRLEEFALSKGMSKPTFRVVPRMSEGNAFYSCCVKIDDFKISSYPDERPTPGEAMQVACKQALEELNDLSSVIGGSATQDENMIMSRVSQIVGEHRNGIWSSHIPLDYNQKYSEILPDDWLKIMSRCPLVSLQHVAENRIIITPNWPSEATSPVSPATVTTVNPMELPHGRHMLSPIGFAVPDQITLPQDDVWDVFITCGKSTDEIWIRLIGDDYSVQYENLATDMEMFYMGKSVVAISPEVGLYYAIKMDDCWHRVKLVEISETGNEGQVFFIDHGDEEVVELKELHVLERRFARLPAQAVLCYLWGLEDFVDDPNSAKHITESIVGKTMIADVKFRARPDCPAHGVLLFDTSTNEDLNMNSILIENISKEAMAPQLPLEGSVKEVYISHVSPTGDIFLQFESYSYLQSLVADVIGTGLKENDIQKGSEDCTPNPSRLYLARYHLDGNWYRAAITKKLEGREEVEVMFVDFGNTEIISPSNLILLEAVKKTVADFPHQAVKVHLHKVKMENFNEKMALRVRELVPHDERVLVKTVSSGHTPLSVPEVEIFKRIQPDNLLVSICDTLAYDPDLRPSPTEDGARGKKRLDRLHSLTSSGDAPVGSNMLPSPPGLDSKNYTASRGLSPPQIPDINEYFDVHVTMAANPGNFTVQPYKDATRLERMMEDMQAHYMQNKYPHPTPENVHEGGLYAALHNDSHWYRVCVSNVINGNLVSVYFCDYGDVSVLTVDKLQPLTNQFKELPYQAIKAKLTGIQPKHNDWSVEDCLMFQEMVVERQFVSIVMETGPDLLNPSDTVIGLTLIDTSGEEDIFIDKVLIAQERAVVLPVSV